MPKRISKKTTDPNQIAASVVALATEEPQIDRETLSRVMSAMGRKGGRIGGKRRLKTMPPAERKRRAKEAADARWAKHRKKSIATELS